MSEFVDRLKTRGHWTVVVRPVQFDAARVSTLGKLERAVRDSAVSLRGWDYPHLDFKTNFQRRQDWVGQEFEWQHHVELWRAYKSGQFISLNAILGEWFDQSTLSKPPRGWAPGRFLWVADAVYRLTEITEFAARYSQTEAGGDHVHIETTLDGLHDRCLRLEPVRGGVLDNHFSTADRWTQTRAVDRQYLMAETQELALELSLSLFELFGWDVEKDTLRGIQSELRR